MSYAIIRNTKIKTEVSRTAWVWKVEMALDMDIALTMGS